MPTIGEPLIVLDTVDSTNIHAMRLASGQDVRHGTVFFARRQTAGKGQWGRSWHSEPDAGILMSAVVDPVGTEGGCGFALSVATVLACIDLLRGLLPGELQVKWPNDLYWHDRKAGGILIENILRGGRCRRSVIGIGINVNQSDFDPALPNPVSIRQVTGREYDVVALAGSLCGHLDGRLAELEGGGREAMLSEYNGLLFGRGRELTFRSDEGVFKAVVEGVDHEGVLTLLRPQPVRYLHGALEYLPGLD
jgi:BirA family biotin operon repressor/biotin-[acetyl-CoA-carboxylase] ligase